MRSIASTATVDPACELGADVEIGPGCVVGPRVRLGDGCRLLANVYVAGDTVIGEENVFYPGCVIGAPPQDLKHSGEDTRLHIGDHNVFREYVTVHTGTVLGGGLTTIGCHNQLQVGSHVAHDVLIGDHCILSNGVQVAGHVCIEDYVTISGMTGIHQFVTFGKYSFVAGMARVTTDVPPFLMFSYDGTLAGVNNKGLLRWGFTETQCNNLKRLYRQLFPRHGREEESRGPRTLLEMLFSRRARRGALSLHRRIEEAEANDGLDENCRYLVTFLKRSLNDGKYGRYLESARKDAHVPPPKFYAAAPQLGKAAV
jgi:UDP-N-acetylglucosamine acyltransferase